MEKYMVPCSDCCFVDVGANIGFWTFHVAKNGVEVHAFEPSPETVKKLSVKAKKNRHIHVYPFALGESNHSAKLMIHRASGNDGLKRTYPTFTGLTVDIPVRSLDSFRIENVGLIKVDTEGYELKVLQGAKQTILRDKPRLVIETHETAQMNAIFHMLKSWGYKCVLVRNPMSAKPPKHIVAESE